KVYAFDYAPDAPLSNKRVAVDLEEEEGFPDGMTKDAEGHAWIAHYAGSCITRWNLTTGEKLDHVDFPVSNPTCPIFYEDRLLVTTAANGDDAPHAGAVFAVTFE
ncbi:MAG TPA: gluconolaconase, partial [Exiguobacterium sp.]|nr:gluconolaconase [Exiguobacterium sp.]